MFSGWKKGGNIETEDDLIRNAEVKRRLIGELSLAVKEVFIYKLIMHQSFEIPSCTSLLDDTRGKPRVFTLISLFNLIFN